MTNPISLAFYADPAFQSSAGIEQYTRRLLAAACDAYPGAVHLLTTREEWAAVLRESYPARVVRIRIPFRLLRYSWSLAGWPPVETLVGAEVTLAHNPTTMRIPTRHCPAIVTVHDLFSIRHPALLSYRQRLVLTRTLEARAVRHASHIIADSHSTRHDILELFGVPEDRVSVVHLGVDHSRFRPVADDARVEEVRARYDLRRPFVLYVGSLYSRKLGKLLDAFRRVAETQAEVDLVIVGGREATAAGDSPLEVRIRALGLAGRVRLTGAVPAADVPVLMSAAAVFAYVSFYEGFGLSPLEAMACGAPVVVSAVSSLPEVVGEAGLRVDPQNVEEIAAAISSVLSQPSRAERMRRASLEQAARFSWERTAAETLEVYRAVASGERRAVPVLRRARR